ncbi:MAG: hypothetical protein LBL07_19145 [Tannerella sp.]|jgi:methionyl-tRNA formyltransferase|nr:hypothetical protein [Tannerella sp.]
MIRVLIITTGYSSFVSDLNACNQLYIVGILNCRPSDELKQYAGKRDIPYKELKSQDSELFNWIKSKEPEVIAIFKMPFLLKKEIYSLPKYGSLNLHPSLLPNYRGPNPWFWIYYNMETESGVTIHALNEKEDAGEILLQEKFRIPLGAKLEDLKKEAVCTGTKLMIKALCNIKNRSSIPQPTNSPTVRAENIRDYQGLIDWENWSVKRIWHLLHGFPEILQTNESYLSLHQYLTPFDYSIKRNNSPAGQFVFTGYYMLNCIDGMILFHLK